MSTFLQLKTDLRAYAHRTDLDDQIPGFIERARTRINRDVRVAENMQRIVFTPTTNPFRVPDDDLLEIRGISTVHSSTRTFSLKNVSRSTINFYNIGTGSGPVFYTIDGKDIEIQPFGSVELTMIYYFAAPPFNLDTDTSELLVNHYQLWLGAALIELHTYVQDQDLRDAMIETYGEEVRAASDAHKWTEAGPGLQTMGASHAT